MTLPTATSVWLPYRRAAPQPAVRLFCLPPAGAAASLFRGWPQRLPPEVEACAVQLPGRESRWRDPPPASLDALVDGLAEAVGPLLDPGYVIFGASFGGLLGYLLTHRLRMLGHPEPVHLFIAATPAPDRVPPPPARSPGAPARSPGALALPANAELARLVGRILDQDVRLIDEYRYALRPPLGCPLTVFGGRADRDVPVEDLLAWHPYSTGDYTLHLLPGGHLLVQESPGALLDRVRTALDPTSGR